MLAGACKAQAGAAAKDSRSQADRRGRDKLQEGPQLHDGHSRKVFDAFFEQIGDKGREPIDLVSANGARWVDDAMKEWVPYALHCTDTFHIVQWAAELLDELRRQSWRAAVQKAKAAPKGRRARPRKGEEASPERKAAAFVKGPRDPLLKNPESLTERQKVALQLTAILQPRLHRAYLLKEGIRLALKLPANKIREGIGKCRGRAWRSRIPQVCRALKEDQKASGCHSRHLGERPVQRTRRGHQQQDQADREDGLWLLQP